MSLEEKVKLLEECINGRIRQREAARRAGVTIGGIQRWLSHYRTGGRAALEHNERRHIYSKETKRSAVEEYLCGRGSLLSISEKYQISTPSLLLEWVQVYHRHNNTQTEEEESVMAGRRTGRPGGPARPTDCVPRAEDAGGRIACTHRTTGA